MFGTPLKESLKHASVQISTADAKGKLYVWGYIPVVVAKWCVYAVIALPPPLFFFSSTFFLSVSSYPRELVLMLSCCGV